MPCNKQKNLQDNKDEYFVLSLMFLYTVNHRLDSFKGENVVDKVLKSSQNKEQ